MIVLFAGGAYFQYTSEGNWSRNRLDDGDSIVMAALVSVSWWCVARCADHVRGQWEKKKLTVTTTTQYTGMDRLARICEVKLGDSFECQGVGRSRETLGCVSAYLDDDAFRHFCECDGIFWTRKSKICQATELDWLVGTLHFGTLHFYWSKHKEFGTLSKWTPMFARPNGLSVALPI